MPSPEELVQAVKEMRAQGLSDDEIRETLLDMGVPENAVEKLLAGESVDIPSAEEHAEEGTQPENVVETPAKPQEPKEDFLFAPTPSQDVLSKIAPSSASGPAAEPETREEQKEKELPVSDEFSVGVVKPPILEEEPEHKIEEIHSKVEELHKTLSSAPLRDDIAEVKEMLRDLRKDVRQVHAMFGAIQKLLQEILETDRSILVDLYERTKK